MTSRPLSTIRNEIFEASLARDLKQVEHLLLEGYQHPNGQAQEFLRPLARLYEEREDGDEALGVWKQVFAEVPDAESAFNILRHKAADLETDVRAWLNDVATPVAMDSMETWLQAERPAPAHACRHIAICGISYSGSTVLGRLFDGVDGVHDIGESHWLIDQREAVNGSRLIDFLTDQPSPSMSYCRQCGEACPVLTRDFRFGLRVDRRDWYQRIAARVETTVLVSSDKNIPKYVSLDPRLRLDGIVLFKSPVAAWQSFRKRLKTGGEEAEQTALSGFIRNWGRQYESALKLRPAGRKIFLHFDKLVSTPKESLTTLLAALDLPDRSVELSAANKGKHAIGGNDGFFEVSREADRFEVRHQRPPELPADHIRQLMDDPRLWRVYGDMLAQSQAVFGS